VLASAHTVSQVQQRFTKADLNAALYGRERTGRPTEIDGEAEVELIMLACSQPPEGRSHS
jgi:hypothetical protein